MANFISNIVSLFVWVYFISIVYLVVVYGVGYVKFYKNISKIGLPDEELHRIYRQVNKEMFVKLINASIPILNTLVVIGHALILCFSGYSTFSIQYRIDTDVEKFKMKRHKYGAKQPE